MKFNTRLSKKEIVSMFGNLTRGKKNGFLPIPEYNCKCVQCGDNFKSFLKDSCICSQSCNLDYEEENYNTDGQTLSQFI